MKDIVILVNPPNDDQLSASGTLGHQYLEHTDWANMPHGGLLSLASYLEDNTRFQPVYADGTVIGLKQIMDFINANQDRVAAVGASVLSANWETAARFLKDIKSLNSGIKTVIGNDHASFAASSIASSSSEFLDAIFVGDNPYAPFADFVLSDLPTTPSSRMQPSIFDSSNASLFPPQRYNLIDRVFVHSSIYRANFRRGVGAAVYEKLGISLSSGIPIHIAQGCVKFVLGDPCSFCSIYPGATGKSQVSEAETAWFRIRHALDSGYDYLYITADELPQTFSPLLSQMLRCRPNWAPAVFGDGQALLVGYARADGLASKRSVQLLKDLGFGLLMVGFDGINDASLGSLGKGMVWEDQSQISRQRRALENCRKSRLMLKAGIIVGFFGAIQADVLRQVSDAVHLIEDYRDVLFSVDVEILCPEPGSRDYRRLYDPEVALMDASRLNIGWLRKRLSAKITTVATEVYTNRNACISAYVSSFMKDVDVATLIEARQEIRSAAIRVGVHLGT